MKNSGNTINFTDYLNKCLKKDPSMKTTTQLKMGLTVNTFHTNTKIKRKHFRNKTDEFYIPQSMSTTAVFLEGKLKGCSNQKAHIKKFSTQAQLKKVNSYKVLGSNNQFRSCSTYKSNNSKDTKQQTLTAKSIQKLRKDLLNKTNPEISTVTEQLRQISNSNKGSLSPGTMAHQYYMLTNQLLQTIKSIHKKHSGQLISQKQMYQRREKKLIGKLLQLQTKNQNCNVLINELRVKNVDIDGIWNQEKLNSKTSDLINKK